MSEESARLKGEKLREEMFGAAGMKSYHEADAFTQPLQDVVTRICFGEVWSRPQLSPKIRSMLTIAMLVGMSRPNQLKNHVRGAIRNGVTKEEIREILLHATIYAGVPAGTDSWQHAADALKEIGSY